MALPPCLGPRWPSTFREMPMIEARYKFSSPESSTTCERCHMKPEARVMNVTSTLQGERVGMSIDEGALAHIMSVLTDLYSDPEMAVIREYSTNALDAHVEAGVTRPIEVTLPSALSPYLKIRDYGTGLDVEDIRTIYSR